MVVLACHHAAQAAEIAFGLIGASAVMAVGFAVIDALYLPAIMQMIPMACFIGMNDGHAVNVYLCQFNTGMFVIGHKGQGAAFTLTHGDNNPALAGLKHCLAAVNPVFCIIGRADMTTKIRAVNLDFAVKVNRLTFG